MFVMPVSRPVGRSARSVAIGDLNRAVDRLFDNSFDRFLDGVRTGAARLPAVDLVETDTAYTLTAELPGLSKEEVKVSIIGKQVSIEAESKSAAQATDGATASRPLLSERDNSRFERRFSLPLEIDEQGSSARFDNGLLVLNLLKKSRPQATQLPIG